MERDNETCDDSTGLHPCYSTVGQNNYDSNDPKCKVCDTRRDCEINPIGKSWNKEESQLLKAGLL